MFGRGFECRHCCSPRGMLGCSVVGSVPREPVWIDVDAKAGAGWGVKETVADLQWLGQQVVTHIQEVRQLAGPPGGELVRRPECHGARRADLPVDLVAHHDLQAQALREVVHPLRAVLILIAVADLPSTSRVTSAGVGTDSSAMNGTSRCSTSQRRPITSSAGHNSSANNRSRSAISFMARNDSDAVQPRLPSTYSSTAPPNRSRNARTTAVSNDTGRRPTLTLNVVMP